MDRNSLSKVLFAAFLVVMLPNILLSQETQQMPPEATEFYEPVPPVVNAGTDPAAPPSDAVVLFDGSNLDAWQSAEDGSDAEWSVSNGVLTVKPGTGAIKTNDGYGDVQLHLEWRSPEVVKGEGQGRGNSGVFLMEKYEVQVLDSYQNKTYTNGQAGSVYKQNPPLVNATNPPGMWNTYDIIFKRPRFDKNGMLVNPATVTVLHNGVLVQNHFELRGPTEYIGIPNYTAHPDRLSIVLQDHGDLVSFRNIWVRDLE